MIIRFLLILFLIYLVFNRVFKFLMGVGTSPQQSQQRPPQNPFQRPQSSQPSDGNVRIDYIPEKKKRKRNTSASSKGGEYIDYEELD
ncbi:MAG TPA: hypothetical protein DCE41_35055 [Cytophagales bacterium]|nr:hypothetical protein [Cytophagales bacterium]HAA24174.1 hypothetical protein [Cytophagales bacterium]HAP60977.1 hypothetical protein [Cytophagales bacterium]